MAKRSTNPGPATTEDMRQPIQERAQATIDRICAAATAILTEQGWDAFNTNAVAARAGVSGPTVYRYFPNKYVLAAELRRRVDESEARAAVDAIERIPTSTRLSVAVRTWIDATATARAGQPAAILLRSIPRSIPDLQDDGHKPDAVLTALTNALHQMRPTLAQHACQVRGRAILTSVDALIDDALREGAIDKDQLQTIVDVATALITSATSSPEMELEAHSS